MDAATTWTRILSVTAGASCAAGAPGPGTRVRGKAAIDFAQGPWLGLFDFDGVRRDEREALLPWLFGRAEPLLLVRHLLLAKPLGEEIFIDLTERALEAMPPGWRDGPRPILILAPAGRSRPERRREYLDALSQLRIPLVSGELWAVREFDVEFLASLAKLSRPSERAALRESIDPSQQRLFDLQVPACEAAALDDLVGARDEESALLDVNTLSALHPGSHPLALFGAVERAQNSHRRESERTHYSSRSIEARLVARGFPEEPRAATADFSERLSAVAPVLPGEAQLLFEASELLTRRWP